MSGATPNLEFFERIERGLKALGAIEPLDVPTKHGKPPSVVVERMDVIKKWAWAMVRAETARELSEVADQLDQLDPSAVASALRDRADALGGRRDP